MKTRFIKFKILGTFFSNAPNANTKKTNMPQLLKPYNPWFIGIEAGLAAALVSAGVGDNLSLGSAVGVAVVIGGWNYYVQKNYPVPRALIEKAEVLQFKKYERSLDRSLGGGISKQILAPAAQLELNNWEQRIASDAAKQF